MFDKEYYLKKYQEENDPNNKRKLAELAKKYYKEYEERKNLCQKAYNLYYKKYIKPINKISVKRNHAKRRQLGFVPLNKPFKNCEAHHISENFIIYIPREIHKSIYHSIWNWKNMEEMNKLAINFLKKQANEY